MLPNRAILAGAAILLLASCQSGGDSRADRRDRQLEEALVTQDRQCRIEEFAKSLPGVDAATAYLRPDSAVVRMALKSGANLARDDQEKLNRFITDLTGVPRSGIALWVPERSVPGRSQ
jgi:hypothetical protein